MDITFFGHNSFLIKSDVSIFIDPFITPNPKAKEININEIIADFILITHGHMDHIADVDKILQHNDAKIIAIVEVAGWLAAQGHTRLHGLNFGGTYHFSNRTSAKFVQAVHSSSMPDGTYGGQPGSYIFKTQGKTIFIAGDTALHSDLKLFGALNSIDLAILPIGGNYTMDVEDAVHAAKFLGCEKVIGCHYNTFPEITIDHQSAIELFNSHKLDLMLLTIGEKISI
ncbi:MAG: metal-dependent hydrolase [Flammeovirgaceae bacterium]|nr:metal-dependent hydrolase [Flammeovirgaceae bacterium]